MDDEYWKKQYIWSCAKAPLLGLILIIAAASIGLIGLLIIGNLILFCTVDEYFAAQRLVKMRLPIDWQQAREYRYWSADKDVQTYVDLELRSIAYRFAATRAEKDITRFTRTWWVFKRLGVQLKFNSPLVHMASYLKQP